MHECFIYIGASFDPTANIGASSIVVIDRETDKVVYERGDARRIVGSPDAEKTLREQLLASCIRAVTCAPEGARVIIYATDRWVVDTINHRERVQENLYMIDQFSGRAKSKRIHYEIRQVLHPGRNERVARASAICHTATINLKKGGARMIEFGEMPCKE